MLSYLMAEDESFPGILVSALPGPLPRQERHVLLEDCPGLPELCVLYQCIVHGREHKTLHKDVFV